LNVKLCKKLTEDGVGMEGKGVWRDNGKEREKREVGMVTPE